MTPQAESAPPLRLMCALVVKGAFERAVLPAFAAAGGRLDVVWAPTTVIQDRLAQGETADLVLLTTEATAALVAAGHADPATQIDVVQSQLGVAVLPGAPRPDLSTAAAFQSALLSARSVAFSKGGASGIYFAGLIERLGIAEAIRAKATIIPSGFTAEKLLTGEADLAIQQVSELMAVTGVEIVGPFPAELQAAMQFSAVVLAGSPAHQQAVAFLALLATDAAAAAFSASGLEPLR
jgi:molybdate transport system substrate-binding protein